MKISTTIFRQITLVVFLFFAFSLSVFGAVYEKVTTAPTDWSGKYLIVYESGKVAFDGSRATLDATSNNKIVTISDNKINLNADIYFTIIKDGSNYLIQSFSGYYVGQTSNDNGLLCHRTTKYYNTISLNNDKTINIKSSAGAYLRYNAASNQNRFRYYKSSSYTGQKAICLYKLVEEQSCIDPTISFDSTAIKKIYGDANFTNTLTTNSDGEITYSSSDTNVATADATTGKVSITGVGTTTITASIAATSTYCEVSASYELIVTSPRVFTITWIDGDNVLETSSCKEGSLITFPNQNPSPNQACQYEGWEFAGWSTDNITEETEHPTILDNTYIPTSDVTLYAVYKKETEKLVNDAVVWVQKPIEEIKYNDVVIITMTTNNGLGNTYAMSNNNGTGSAPTAVKVTKNGSYLDLSSTDNILWNVTNDNGTLTIYPNSTTEIWLYCQANNNGVRVGTNENKTFVIDVTYGYLQHKGTKRYLGVYEDNLDWRCYDNTTGNTANQSLAFYVKSFEERVALVDVYSSNISCEPIEEYMITFGDSEPIETQNKKIVNIPVLLESCNLSYSTKVGWTTEASFGVSSTEFVLVDENTQFTQNTQLYPVYSKGVIIAGEVWALVTDVSTLAVGDQVVIAAKDYNCALSTTQNTNNRGQVSITKNGDNISFGNGVQILTLKAGTTSGTLAFYTGSGYLYAASSSSNHLKTQTTNNANGSWEITIVNGGSATIVAQGTNTRNTMQYNQSSSLFSCYASASQKPLSIYKKVPATKPEYFICSDLIVESDTTFNVEDDLNINNLTIKSNLDQAGQLNTTNASITAGNVTIEKTIDASRYYFFSLPFDCDLNNVVAIDSNGVELQYADSPTTGDYVINYYDQTRNATTNKAWVELIGTSHTLKANQGYIIGHFGTGDVTVKFPSKDAVTISAPANKTLNYTDSWTAGDVENSTNGWNLIGMPYYQKPNNGSLSADINVYYATMPNDDGKTYTQTTFADADIAPFTSFFVQTEVAPTFTISAQQNAAPKLIDGHANNASQQKAVIAFADANGAKDKTTIINNPNNTNEYEIGHDLAKWIGYAARPQIYSIQGDDILAFNSRAIDNSTVIPLGVYAHADGEYTFVLDEKSVGDLQGWDLYDNEVGATVRLVDNSYGVYLEKGTHEGRFELRLQQRIATDCGNTMGSVEVWTENGTLNMNNMPTDAVVYVYDAVGRMVDVINPNSQSFSYDFAVRGVYNIVISSPMETITFKTIY